MFDSFPRGLRPRRLVADNRLDLEDDGQDLDLRGFWEIIRKRRWTVISVLIVVLTAALLFSVKETPVYRSQVLLEVEKENPNIVTPQELFQLENVSDNYLETQYKILASDSLARRVIAQLHLDQVPEFNPPGHWWNWILGEKSNASQALPTDPLHEQATLRRFENHLDVEPLRRSRLVKVTFDSQNAKLSAEVLNAFASNYIDENLELRWDAAQKASGWLSQQLQTLKIKLEKSEDNLQAYAQANGLLFLETEKGNTENIVDERLRELQDELTQAQADLYQKESMYRLVQTQNDASLPGVEDNKLMQDLTERLADLEKQKAQLTPNFNPSYPALKEVQSEIDQVQKLLVQERSSAAQRITDDYLAAADRAALVKKAFEQQQAEANLVASRSVQYNILKREVDTNKQIYDSLLQRLKEAGVASGLKASNIRIVDSAVPPALPFRPNYPLNLGVAFLLGLSGGIGLAFLQERLDNTVKDSEDVERFLGMPSLSLIPMRASLGLAARPSRLALLKGELHRNGNGNGYGHANGKGNGHRARKLLLEHPAAWVRIDHDHNGAEDWALGEAFRNLRTSVLFSIADRQPRSLVVLSAEPGEGKTTVCANLAIALAQLGKRVLLIDGDMRRPSVHKLFAMEDCMGLAGYLTAQEEWPQLVHPSGISGLDCIVCGVVPPNPSELLSSERMGLLVREAAADYHFVLIDSPPLLSVADGRIIAALADGALLVVRSSSTRRESAQLAQSQLQAVGARVIGVVLNGVPIRPDGYNYGYYHQPPQNGNGSASHHEVVPPDSAPAREKTLP